MDKEKEIEELVKIARKYSEKFANTPYYKGVKTDMEAIYEAGYRKADEVRKEKAKEILNGLVHWLKGAIRVSYDFAVRNPFGIHGGKNCAFHEMLDLVKKVAEKEGIEVDG